MSKKDYFITLYQYKNIELMLKICFNNHQTESQRKSHSADSSMFLFLYWLFNFYCVHLNAGEEFVLNSSTCTGYVMNTSQIKENFLA